MYDLIELIKEDHDIELSEFKDFCETLLTDAKDKDKSKVVKDCLTNPKEKSKFRINFKKLLEKVRKKYGDTDETISIFKEINDIYETLKIKPSVFTLPASLEPSDVIKGITKTEKKAGTTRIPPLDNEIVDKIISIRIEKKKDDMTWLSMLLTTSVEEITPYFDSKAPYLSEREDLIEKYKEKLENTKALNNRYKKYSPAKKDLPPEPKDDTPEEKTGDTSGDELHEPNEELKNLKEKLSKVENELHAEKEQLKAKRIELDQTQVRLSILNTRYNSLGEQLNEALKTSKRLKSENKDLQEEIDTLYDKNEELQSALDRAKKRSKDLKGKSEAEYASEILSNFVKNTHKNFGYLAQFVAEFKESDENDETKSVYVYTIEELFADMKKGGIHIIGGVGEKVEFEPGKHSLISGSQASESDSVTIRTPGWEISNDNLPPETIIKAEVEKVED